MEMECLRAQATMSAIHDGEHVTDENAEAARAHLAECEQCGAFDADLGALAQLPAPQAPADLVDRIMVAVAAIASEEPLEEPIVVVEEVPEIPEELPESPRFTWFTGRARIGIYGAMATAAAALVLVAFISMRTPAVRTADERRTAATGSGAVDLTFSGQGNTEAAAAAPAPTPAPARAPDYLTYRGRAYSPGALLADSTAATQSIGTVSTAFGGAGGPTQVPAYRSPITDGSIVVAGPDGARLYTPVVRMFNSVKYQMVAGNAVDRFGLWPELPSRFPVPAAADGSPTFAPAGGDALGVQTYTARGVPQTQGFAVAPGTPSTDPAGSNPNWTWWEPLLIP